MRSMIRGTLVSLTALLSLLVPVHGLQLQFQTGDVFVSLETGPVQWRLADGTLRAVLIPTVPGWGEGMAFDRAGKLYVARWRAESLGPGLSGNAIERFNTFGTSEGSVGGGFNCDPHTIVFDTAGNPFVGQAACRRSLLKFSPSWALTAEHLVAEDDQGVFWVDLAPDNCTVFYTSFGFNVKRYDTCAGLQLPDFNAAPLPSGISQDLRVLPDGGVLVSSGQVIARLDAAGVLTRTYEVAGEGSLWVGLDLAGEGSFWAADYYSSGVYKFDLASGAILDSFNTGTQPNTVVSVRVLK